MCPVVECSLVRIFCPNIPVIPPQMTKQRKKTVRYLGRCLIDFRWRMKKIATTSMANITIAALDRVERTSNPNSIVYPICFLILFFLRNQRAKTGKKAISRNPKLIGLSKRNLFLTRLTLRYGLMSV